MKTVHKLLVCGLVLLHMPAVLAQPAGGTASREHFFPLVADGGGFRFRLFLINTAEMSNRCVFEPGPGLDANVFESEAEISREGAGAVVELASGNGATAILRSAGERALAFGFAKLACAEPVIARMLLQLEADGSTAAMTALAGARMSRDFQLPLSPGLGRLNLIFANDSDIETFCAVELEDAGGAAAGGASVVVPPRTSYVRALDELIAAGDGFGLGKVAIGCAREVAVLGMAVHDGVFAALTPVLPDGDGRAADSQFLPLVADGDGFRSELHIANPMPADARCEVNFHGAGLDVGRFRVQAGTSSAVGTGMTFDLKGGGYAYVSSQGGGSLAFGYAAVECDGPVVAGNFLSLEINGAAAGLADVPASRQALRFNFPAPARDGRLALAVSNGGAGDASCTVELTADGERIGGFLAVSERSTAVRFLEDLIPPEADFQGGVASVTCDRAVHAVTLPLRGAAFAALPPAILAEGGSPDAAPVFESADFPPLLVYPLGEPIEPLQLPEASGGEPPLTYSLEPVPPGLSFDAGARELAGTPAGEGEFLSVYEARDANGESGVYPLFILVTGPDTAPSFAGVSAPADQAYTLGVEIEPLQLPEAAGGNAPLTHFLQPEVPGLNFDPETRQLRGTPGETGVYHMKYTAADIDFDTDSLEFTVTVTVPESSRSPLGADGCGNGDFVDGPEANPGLAADCRALTEFADALIETGLIMEDNVIRRWGREGQQKLASWSGVRAAGGRITGLELPYASLKGDFPAALARLDALTALDLRGNELSGAIPPGFGGLAGLEELSLSANRLGGPIPPELSQLAELRALSLEANRLTGPIPQDFGNLAKLEELKLWDNELSGPIPAELARLANLRELDLDVNSLSGPIPPELGNLGNLEKLGLAVNELSGDIPPELGRLARLEEMALAYNRLDGAIPAELGNLRRLRSLDLSGNDLGGAIPPELAELSALEYLDLSFNELTGGVPRGFAGQPRLEYLDVSFNRLRGVIDWAFRERIAEDGLRLETGGNAITGLGPPPERPRGPSGDATHHSIAWYQGPLVLEWDWQGDRIEAQTPILGRWALLAVRVDHAAEAPPPVITRVLDAGDAVLAASLAEAAPPITERVETGGWRSEFLFHLPGKLFQSGNQIVHVIDPENEREATGNAGEAIVIHGERPPKFRAVFVPVRMPGEDAWHEDLDPEALMAGTLAFMPIADDFDARIGPPIEVEDGDIDEALLQLFMLWNAEAEPDEFWHGVVNDSVGGVALLAEQVAVSELSIHIVIPHEFGHNLGLEHTPGCFAEGVDDDYPYPDGALGPEPGWERNWRLFASGEDKDYTDIMSYCTERKLISDYNYRLAAEYWLAWDAGTGAGAAMSAVGAEVEPPPGESAAPGDADALAGQGAAGGVSVQAAATEPDRASVAFSGVVDAGGVWRLSQAQFSARAPRSPPGDGEFTLILFDGAGVQIHSEPLTVMTPSEGEESFWAARTPPPLRPAREIAILDAQGNELLRQTLTELD